MDEQLYLLIGELKAGQAGVRKSIDELTASSIALGNKFNTLPCVSHSEDIEALLEWKKNLNGASQAQKIETLKGTISLKNGIILIVTTAVATGLATMLFEVLAK